MSPYARALAKVFKMPFYVVQIKKYPCGEKRLTLPSLPYKEKRIVVLQHFSCEKDTLISLMMLTHTLKGMGVRSITLAAPYFPYGRSDQMSPFSPSPLVMLGDTLRAHGVKHLVTMDAHSSRLQSLLSINVSNIFPHTLFAEQFFMENINCVVAPDQGAAQRANHMAALLKAPCITLQKVRTPLNMHASLTHPDSEETLSFKGRTCLIVDDIIASGQTLRTASQLLIERGAGAVYACITHCTAKQKNISSLSLDNIKQMWVTDALSPLRTSKSTFALSFVSAALFFAKSLKKILDK